jgi:hypothetical protein
MKTTDRRESARKDAVENQDMEMHVEIQTAEPLHEEHRSALGAVDAFPLGPGTIDPARFLTCCAVRYM